MKGLDGLQGPIYVGTGCVFRRQALYGYDAPAKKKPPSKTCNCWPKWGCVCCGSRKNKRGKTKKDKKKKSKHREASKQIHALETIEEGTEEGRIFLQENQKLLSLHTEERNKRIKNTSKHLPELSYISSFAETNTVSPTPISQEKLEKRFGQSPVFAASTLREDGGIPNEVSSTSLLKEAIHVISCGYEDKTEWGKEVNKAV